MAKFSKSNHVQSIPVLSWHDSVSSNVVLLQGSETFLADKWFKNFKNYLVSEFVDVEVIDLDAEFYSVGSFLIACEPSIFDEPKLIRLGNVDKASDDFLADTESVLASKLPSNIFLVFYHKAGVKGKRLLNTIRSMTGLAVEVRCDALKNFDDKAAFVRSEFQFSGCEVDFSAVSVLLNIFPNSIAELSGVISQLVADADGGVVSEHDVLSFFAGKEVVSVFKVVDAAVAGQIVVAVQLLRLSVASGHDLIPILAALAAKIRLMAKLFDAYESASVLASRLGIPLWQVDRVLKDNSFWTSQGLANCLVRISDCDFELKGGSRDPLYALESCIIFVARRGL